MPKRVLGIDLAPNHGGFVELVDGELGRVWYVSDYAGSAKRSQRGTYLKGPNTTDRQLKLIARLAFWERYLWALFDSDDFDFVGLEDYALDANQGAHYTGEVSGLCKMLLLVHKIPFRLHGPSVVKMFAAHNGNASKLAMLRTARDRWDADFSRYDHVPKDPNQVNTQTSEDLSDALAVAHVVWAEVQVRSGEKLLSDFPEKEVAVFNRMTKAQPLPLLEREWLRLDALPG